MKKNGYGDEDIAPYDPQITFRVTYEFKARLEAQAEKEHRPVANLIHKVMEEYLEQQEEQA